MDLQLMVGDSCGRLATLLEAEPTTAWDRPSLCAGWRAREVVAHMTMPARMTNEQFGAELAAVGGDFQLLSDSIAVRDSELPVDEHLAALRSAALAAWQPPGGGAAGALNHAVVHGLDVTNALGLPRACSDDAARAVLDGLVGGIAARLDVELAGLRLHADDLDWSWGSGPEIVAPAAELISLASNRTLPGGRRIRRSGATPPTTSD